MNKVSDDFRVRPIPGDRGALQGQHRQRLAFRSIATWAVSVGAKGPLLREAARTSVRCRCSTRCCNIADAHGQRMPTRSATVNRSRLLVAMDQQAPTRTPLCRTQPTRHTRSRHDGAGETKSSLRGGSATPIDPRRRGVNRNAADRLPAVTDRSPQARVKPNRRDLERVHDRSIPAGAGETRACAEVITTLPDRSPRARVKPTMSSRISRRASNDPRGRGLVNDIVQIS